MFEKERFIEDCRAALKEGDTHAAIRELVATAVSEPVHVLRALGEPQRAGVETIYGADNLTILNLCWGPSMKFKPHDHRMWAVIGIYGGREQNTLLPPCRARLGATREQGAARERHDPAGRSDYSCCYEPTGSDYGGDPRLRRRFLCHASQRMGS